MAARVTQLTRDFHRRKTVVADCPDRRVSSNAGLLPIRQPDWWLDRPGAAADIPGAGFSAAAA
jgi:hypothetical protein